MNRDDIISDRPLGAFLLSAALHGVVIAVLVLLSYVANQQVRSMPKVLELVAGEGDNYGAKVAPAGKAPVTKATESTTVPNFAREIRNKVIRAESKAKAEVQRERLAEAKRLAEEQKKMTKEEFDRLNKTRAATPNLPPPKVAKSDEEGISKGVTGGSTENNVGGAGGKALVNDNDDVLTAYFSLFKQRVRREFEPPAGLNDTLVANVEVRSNADGSLSNPRITKSSGSKEFDAAVLDALRRVRMPVRPDGKSETIQFEFSARERDGAN